MTQAQVIAQIRLWIIENHNEEITANILRPILEEMVNQPNDLIGDLTQLATVETSDLVSAINSISVSSGGIVIHYGVFDPNNTPPLGVDLGDFYFKTDSPNGFWQFNGLTWVKIDSSPTPIFQDVIDIPDLLANQSTQNTEIIYVVLDASGDTNLTFPSGETRLQAFYRYNGAANGVINDYTLISAPYSGGGTTAGLRIVKKPTNINAFLQNGDFAEGWVSGSLFVEGVYKGVDEPSPTQLINPDNWSNSLTIN